MTVETHRQLAAQMTGRQSLSFLPTHGSLGFILLSLPLLADWPAAREAALLLAGVGLTLIEFSSLPPQELFRRCAQISDNLRAWQEFDRRYSQELHAGICRVIGFPPSRQFQELFEDVKQNVYLRLLDHDRRALLSLRGNSEGEARAFLRRVAASVALNEVRRRRLEVPFPAPPFAEPGEEDVAVKNLLLRQTLEEIFARKLRGRNKYRKILAFMLHYYDGCKANEIASVAGLNLTARAVENLISRMRKLLREFIESE